MAEDIEYNGGHFVVPITAQMISYDLLIKIATLTLVNQTEIPIISLLI